MERSRATEDREAISLRTDDGWILRGERLRGPGPLVVCGHAMMVDRRTLDRPRGEGLASALGAHGLEVAMIDARGHGESGPRAEQGGRWTYDEIVRRDVPAMVRWARLIAGGRKVVVLGHSLIGHASMIAAGLGGDVPDAIVGYAPNLWAPHLEPSAIARAAKSALLRAWMASILPRGYFDARALGMGTAAEAAPYVAQFASMWARDRLASPDGAIDYEAALGRVAIPVLAFSSEGDRLLARPAAVARFLGLMKSAPVDHRVVRELGHMGFVTDPRAREVWRDTCAWIDALG